MPWFLAGLYLCCCCCSRRSFSPQPNHHVRAEGFIASLAEQDVEGLRQRTSHAQPLPLHEVVASYANATRRLLVLGVGGTFLPATGATANDLSVLTSEQLNLLARLLEDPANTVLLTSGRARGELCPH